MLPETAQNISANVPEGTPTLTATSTINKDWTFADDDHDGSGLLEYTVQNATEIKVVITATCQGYKTRSITVRMLMPIRSFFAVATNNTQVTGFASAILINDVPDDFDLDLSLYGITTMCLSGSNGFEFSPYTGTGNAHKGNYDNIVKFYSKLNSLSLHGVSFLKNRGSGNENYSAFYSFYNVNFSNLTTLDISNTK
jgi:hypothetical protein